MGRRADGDDGLAAVANGSFPTSATKRPWNECPLLDVDDDPPLDWMIGESECVDWSREFEQALRTQREAPA